MPDGIVGGLSHSGGASIAAVDFFKLGITYWDGIQGTKKGDHLVALAKVRSASRSYRASLPARVGVGAKPRVLSHDWRQSVPMAA